MSALVQANTNSKRIGNEFDFGATYQLSPSTSFQFDFGEFLPGAFYGNDIAGVYLAASKLKFSF